jgi:hypothetical protein
MSRRAKAAPARSHVGFITVPSLPGMSFDSYEALRDNVHYCIAANTRVREFMQDGDADEFSADMNALGFDWPEISEMMATRRRTPTLYA